VYLWQNERARERERELLDCAAAVQDALCVQLSGLNCVAVCCSVLQCVAVDCAAAVQDALCVQLSGLTCAAACCSVS